MLKRMPKKDRFIPVIRITEEEEKILNDRLLLLNISPSEYFRLAIRDPSRIETDINWIRFKRWILDGQK